LFKLCCHELVVVAYQGQQANLIKICDSILWRISFISVSSQKYISSVLFQPIYCRRKGMFICISGHWKSRNKLNLAL